MRKRWQDSFACQSTEQWTKYFVSLFGSKSAITLEIVEELQALPPVKSHQPRKIVDMIQVVEKALYDLSGLGNTGALENPLVTKSLESKLPESLKEWLVCFITIGGGRIT